MGLLLVAHAEERRLQDEEVPPAISLGKILQEEGDQEEADVHPVHVGVGRDDDLAVAQPVEAPPRCSRADWRRWNSSFS